MAIFWNTTKTAIGSGLSIGLMQQASSQLHLTSQQREFFRKLSRGNYGACVTLKESHQVYWDGGPRGLSHSLITMTQAQHRLIGLSLQIMLWRVMLTYLHILGSQQFSTITSMTGVILIMNRLLTFGSIKISTADHLSRFLRPSQTFILQ
uniref:Uncharacterized protein n=1 Tax=Salix viminalis TaxID=40686 RepID=A0A6N2KGZ6_SALVM